MATEFPNSNFTSIDISDVFPVDDLPSNISFQKANVLHLPFPDRKFDYIFVRQINYGLTADQWPSALNEMTRVLKVGGILELSESSMFYIYFFSYLYEKNKKQKN